TLDPNGFGIASFVTANMGQGGGTFTFTNGHKVKFTSIERLGQLNLSVNAVEGPGGFTLVASAGLATAPIDRALGLSGAQVSPILFAPALATPSVTVNPPRLAVGDFNGDGTPDLIIAPPPGSAPLVTVIDGKLFADTTRFQSGFNRQRDILAQFFAY